MKHRITAAIFLIMVFAGALGTGTGAKSIKYSPDEKFNELKSMYFIVKYSDTRGHKEVAEYIMTVLEDAYSQAQWDYNWKLKKTL